MGSSSQGLCPNNLNPVRELLKPLASSMHLIQNKRFRSPLYTYSY